MKTPLMLSIAMGAVRAWTRLYTWRLPPALRDARRAEIESDLWESQRDAQRRVDARPIDHERTVLKRSGSTRSGSARTASTDSDATRADSARSDSARTRSMPSTIRTSTQMLGRLALGVPDDLLWRAEHTITTARRMKPTTIALTAIAAAFVLAALWVMPLLTADVLPTPSPIRKFVHTPPPPPPPPPPCPPPALGGCKS